jgi:hypothetical protein
MHVDSFTLTFQYGIPVLLEKGVHIQLVGAS